MISIVLILCACATWYDIRTGRIPNALNYSSIGLLLSTAVIEGRTEFAVYGMLAAGGALAALHYGSLGRGLGLGDVKLAAAIGAALGVHGGLQALAIAFISGACVGVVGLLCGYFQRGQRLPFAPYLALGTGLTVVFPYALGAGL